MYSGEQLSQTWASLPRLLYGCILVNLNVFTHSPADVVSHTSTKLNLSMRNMYNKVNSFSVEMNVSASSVLHSTTLST